MKQEKTKSLTRTAALLALLVLLQAVTKAGGQFVTGTCVNCILATGALMLQVKYGLILAFISPFAAFLLGIGPQLLPVVAVIAAANMLYVLLLGLLAREGSKLPRKLLALAAASLTKFAVLYLLAAKLLCAVLRLPEKQVLLFQAMFSWPQLVTAAAGGAVAFAVSAALRKNAK